MLSASARAFVIVASILALCSLSQAQLSMTGFGQGDQGSPAAPTVCHGVVDLSVGCALPMLGGIP